MTTLLDARDVTFAYGERAVLEGVTLHVARGELVAVVGPNGAGKTTLLHVLLGFERLDRGQLLLAGRELSSHSRREIARQAAFVPQNPRTDFAFSVREVVAMGRTPYLGRFQPESAEDVRAIEAALRLTATEPLADRLLNELSGGERQRVHVARALAQETPLMVLDEPISNLDVEHQLHVLDLLKQLASSGKGVLVALHDLSMVARYADRVLILAERGVAAEGSPLDVITEANLARYFRIRARIERTGPEGRPVVVPLEALH